MENPSNPNEPNTLKNPNYFSPSYINYLKLLTQLRDQKTQER